MVQTIYVQPSALEVIADVRQTKKEDSFYLSIPDDSDGASTNSTNVDISVTVENDKLKLTPQGTDIQVDLEKDTLKVEYQGLETRIKFKKRALKAYNSTTNITSVDLSPHGDVVVIGDSGGGTAIAEASDGTIRRRLEGHYIDVSKVRFFPSAQVVVSAGRDMLLKIWSVRDGSNPRTLLGHQRPVTDVGIIGRGRNIVSSSLDGTVKLWELGSGEVVHSFELGGPVSSLALLDSVSSPAAPVSGTEPDNKPSQGANEFELGGKIVVASSRNALVAYDLSSKTLVRKVLIDAGHGSITALVAIGLDIVYGTDKGVVGSLGTTTWQLGPTIQQRGSAVVALSHYQNDVVVVTNPGVAFAYSVESLKSPKYGDAIPTLFAADPINSVSTTSTSLLFGGPHGLLQLY